MGFTLSARMPEHGSSYEARFACRVLPSPCNQWWELRENARRCRKRLSIGQVTTWFFKAIYATTVPSLQVLHSP